VVVGRSENRRSSLLFFQRDVVPRHETALRLGGRLLHPVRQPPPGVPPHPRAGRHDEHAQARREEIGFARRQAARHPRGETPAGPERHPQPHNNRRQPGVHERGGGGVRRQSEGNNLRCVLFRLG
jgi:hypothetical protein